MHHWGGKELFRGQADADFFPSLVFEEVVEVFQVIFPNLFSSGFASFQTFNITSQSSEVCYYLAVVTLCSGI
jgi:hypothetical protein